MSIRLNAQQCSCVIKLISDTGPFTDEPPTALAGDLLRFNKKQCILFVQWSINPEHILREATDLCLQTRTLQAADSLLRFFESSAVPGDAASSQCLSEWYKARFAELKGMQPGTFLFDPTMLVTGLIQDLAFTLAESNKLEVTNRSVLVPLCFVRSWATAFGDRVRKDRSLLLKVACGNT